MKLLAVITQSEIGGAQRFLLYLVEHLRQKGVEVDVVVGKDGDGELLDRLQRCGVATTTMPVLRRQVRPLQDIRAVFALWRIVRKARPDIVLLLSSKAGAVGSIAMGLVSARPKVVYRIGGWSFKDPGSAWRRRTWLFVERALSRLRDVVVVNSKEDLVLAQRYHLGGRRGTVQISNGIGSPDRTVNRDDARAHLSQLGGFEPDADELWVGCVAGLYPSKAHTNLVDAVEMMSCSDGWSPTERWRVVLVGDGPNRDLVASRIQASPEADRLCLVGRVQEAWKYMSAFDVFVLPSVKEGSPWTVLEAMAAGVPVVATDVGAVAEIVESGATGVLVSPDDPLELAEALSDVLADPLEREWMGRMGAERVAGTHSLAVMFRTYDELFDGLAADATLAKAVDGS